MRSGLAALAFNCLSINLGLIIGMPVIINGALQNKNSTIHFTDEDASWFGGLIFIIQPLGSLFSGYLQELLGRKTCMMLVNIPQFVAWLIIYNATCVTSFFVAAIMLGLSLGFMEAPVLSYIGEISEPRLRGVLSTFGGIFFNLGVLIEMMIGALTDWRTMVLIDAGGPVVAFIALAMVPDSPAWLVTKGRVADAKKAYQWLRGWVDPDKVKEELDDLLTYIQNNPQERVVANVSVSNIEDGFNAPAEQVVHESQVKLFIQPSIQRPLRLIVIFFFIAQCASLSAMRPFMVQFLNKMNLPLDSHIILVIITFLTLLGAITSTLTMHRLGKRKLTFISLSLCTFSCFALGIYLALGLDIPVMIIFLFGISFYATPIGIICVPWILISELFPLRGRGLASGVSAALLYVTIFLVVKTYYSVVYVLTEAGACILYGTVGLLGFVYLYKYLPETEGVHLEDLERHYSSTMPRRSRSLRDPHE